MKIHDSSSDQGPGWLLGLYRGLLGIRIISIFFRDYVYYYDHIMIMKCLQSIFIWIIYFI